MARGLGVPALIQSTGVDIDEKSCVLPAGQIHHTTDPSSGDVGIEGVCAFRVVVVRLKLTTFACTDSLVGFRRLTEEYIQRGRQTYSQFHVICPSVVVEFIVSRGDKSFGSLYSNNILLITRSIFLLNNRNSRPHLFIDR